MYMWNKVISKLFQPSSTSDWNNFISARGTQLPEIISKFTHSLSLFDAQETEALIRFKTYTRNTIEV